MVSPFIAQVLSRKERAPDVFKQSMWYDLRMRLQWIHNNENNKEFTEEQRNELIQEADGGNQWAQYYVGVLFFCMFICYFDFIYDDVDQGTCIVMLKE